MNYGRGYSKNWGYLNGENTPSGATTISNLISHFSI